MKGLFDRDLLKVLPLARRENRLRIDDVQVDPASFDPRLSSEALDNLAETARDIRAARDRGAPVILAFGAHAIKNGLSLVMTRLMEGGWLTHFATNGASLIHDWEFAFQGCTGEDVRRYVEDGQFGLWEETGAFINLAIAVGAFQGLGYGESVGAMIARDGLPVPDPAELVRAQMAGAAEGVGPKVLERAAAAADLRNLMESRSIPPGFLRIDHPRRECSLTAAAFRAEVPLTTHPMFGHDIIYTHPASCGAAVGRTAGIDFLAFAHSVSRLEGGVYLSVGSAVMSPMIFEKALSMARNVAHENGDRIADFAIHVVDLASSQWNWGKDGEPPPDDPAYYLRFCKTFSRMGGRLRYTGADNRSWLVALLRELEAGPL